MAFFDLGAHIGIFLARRPRARACAHTTQGYWATAGRERRPAPSRTSQEFGFTHRRDAGGYFGLRLWGGGGGPAAKAVRSSALAPAKGTNRALTAPAARWRIVVYTRVYTMIRCLLEPAEMTGLGRRGMRLGPRPACRLANQPPASAGIHISGISPQKGVTRCALAKTRHLLRRMMYGTRRCARQLACYRRSSADPVVGCHRLPTRGWRG